MSNGEARVKFVCRKISTLDELTSEFDLVVNCAGFNAGKIANDPNIFPIRGKLPICQLISQPLHIQFDLGG
uniref:D-aspartate oxidase-like n=1 Tax=Phallusia mammillata TaxID=59560 RepID=A0A6F9DB83_9ASCI|nr:D-aspartate oxidase-like [Phallusia mammillata]